MRSPSLTRLLLIGCAILFHTKPAFSRLVPLYVWRRPPTSSPTGAPSFQPSLRPSSQPSYQPSYQPSPLPPVYIASSYLTSEQKSSSFGPWKTITVIGFALCCLGVCFQLVREPYLIEEEDAQDVEQGKKKKRDKKKKQDKQHASSEDEEGGWSNWLSMFWMDDASDAPSHVDEYSFGDESSVTDASFFSFSTNDWSYGKSHDKSNATYDTSSMTYDTCSRTYDTSIMTNDRSSMVSDRKFDKKNVSIPLNAMPNKTLAKGREIVSKGREAGQLVRQRSEKLGNAVKGKVGNVFKKKEPEKKEDDIDVIAHVSSFIDTALDQLGDLAIGEDPPPPQPVKKWSSKLPTRSTARVSKSTKLPAIKENHNHDDIDPKRTNFKVANMKAMVEKKALELKVKMKEKKWQNQQNKAAAAEKKRLEQEVKDAQMLLDKLKLVDIATKEMMKAQMDTILQASSTEAVVFEDEIRRLQEREYRRYQRGRSSGNKASYPPQNRYHYDTRRERWDDYDIEMARKPKVLVVNHRYQEDDIELIKAPSLPDEVCKEFPPRSSYAATPPQKRKGSRVSANQASGVERKRDDGKKKGDRYQAKREEGERQDSRVGKGEVVSKLSNQASGVERKIDDGLRKGDRYQENDYRRKEGERQDSRVGKGEVVSKLSNHRNHKDDSSDCNGSCASRLSSVSSGSKGFMSQEATKSTGSASTIEEIDEYSNFSVCSDKQVAPTTAPMKEASPPPSPAATPPPYEITTVDSYQRYIPKYGCF